MPGLGLCEFDLALWFRASGFREFFELSRGVRVSVLGLRWLGSWVDPVVRVRLPSQPREPNTLN